MQVRLWLKRPTPTPTRALHRRTPSFSLSETHQHSTKMNPQPTSNNTNRKEEPPGRAGRAEGRARADRPECADARAGDAHGLARGPAAERVRVRQPQQQRVVRVRGVVHDVKGRTRRWSFARRRRRRRRRRLSSSLPPPSLFTHKIAGRPRFFRFHFSLSYLLLDPPHTSRPPPAFLGPLLGSGRGRCKKNKPTKTSRKAAARARVSSSFPPPVPSFVRRRGRKDDAARHPARA